MDTNTKIEVRSGNGTEFQPKNAVEQFVVETIEQLYAEKGISYSQVSYICDENRISIFMFKNPWKDEGIDAIAESISESLKQKMGENDFTQIGTVKAEFYIMLNFVKNTKLRKLMPNEKLQNSVTRIIAEAYAEYNFESTARVVVDNEKEVQVWFNSEEPYMGQHFWEFLAKAEAEVRNYLHTKGYKYKGGEWLYDYWIIRFEYKV